MKKELILIIFFAFCIAYKFFSNWYRQRKTIALKRKYESWLIDEDSVKDMTTYEYEILELFKSAKVKNITFPVVIPIGYGKVERNTADLFGNIFQRKSDINGSVLDAFDAAIGYYRTSKMNAISLLYWIETIIFLPRKMIEYIGMDLEKAASKTINLILTAIWWLIGTVFVMYKGDIITFFQSLLEELAK